MKHKVFVKVLLIFFSFVLSSCEYTSMMPQTSSNDYQTWKDSDEAEDLNGDRKIDETDYEIWIGYETWKDSDDAQDMNGDRKIDQDDYQVWQDYEVWKDSDDAQDMNGDRKINQDDYQIWLDSPERAYDEWLESDNAWDFDNDEDIDEADYAIYQDFLIWLDSVNAIDLNDDRTIDELDYGLFLASPLRDYEEWVESDDAKDMDGDSTIDFDDYEIWLDYLTWINSVDASDLDSDDDIDELDYELFLEISAFVGTCHIENYVYTGATVNLYNSGLKIEDFGIHLEQVVFVIDDDGVVTASIPPTTIAAFGEDFASFLEALENITFSKLSDFLSVMETMIIVNDVPLNLTFYLTAVENGYATTVSFSVSGSPITISFDIIYD